MCLPQVFRSLFIRRDNDKKGYVVTEAALPGAVLAVSTLKEFKKYVAADVKVTHSPCDPPSFLEGRRWSLGWGLG